MREFVQKCLEKESGEEDGQVNQTIENCPIRTKIGQVNQTIENWVQKWPTSIYRKLTN